MGTSKSPFSVPRPSRTVFGNVQASSNSSPQPATTDAELSAELNLELLQLTTQSLTEDQLRAQVRTAAIRYSNAVGAGHAVRDADGQWDVKPKHSTGRLPRRNDFPTYLSTRCSNVTQQQTIQVDPLPQVEGCYGIFAPIQQFGRAPEILFLLLPDTVDSRRPIFVAEKLAKTLGTCLKTLTAKQGDWKVSSLSAAIELVSEIENCDATTQAMELAANELSRHLGVGHVAIARADGLGIKEFAVSGVMKIDSRSENYHAFQQCLAESILRDELASWPPEEDSQDQLLLAHRQLASQLQAEAIYSLPLRTVDGKRFGAWLFVGDHALVQNDRFRRFVQVVSPRIANAIATVERSQHPRWLRMLNSIPSGIGRGKAKIGLLAVGAFVALMFLPVPYRVRCNCNVEPDVRRFAVAPFEGTVLKGLVKAGETVEKGQVLAEMDGRSLRYELAEKMAEYNIALKQRAIELADRDIPEMLLAELDGQRLEAEKKLLDFKRDHLKIKSPIAGVVLTGSLERAEASSVKTGDVLFEVGSTDRLLIQIEIPAEDVPQVEVGQSVTIWIEGRSQPITASLQRIRPQSEIRNAKNVFIGELILDDSLELRPGMQGAARIDGKVHSLGWNLFHKPVEFVRSQFSW